MRVSSVRISTRSLRSRLVSGSSMRNARGRRTSARARATRCISPPDICAGRRCSRRSMCSRLATFSTAAAISLGRARGVPAAARRCSRTPCVAGRGRSSGRPWPGRVRPGCHRSRPCRPGAPTRRRASPGRRSPAGSSSCLPRTAPARRRTSRPARPASPRPGPGPHRRTCAGPCAATVPIRPPALPCSRRRRAGCRPRAAGRPVRRRRNGRSVASARGRRAGRRGRRRR